MKFRQVLFAVVIIATMWHSAAAQPKKRKTQAEAPPIERVLAGTKTQSNVLLADLTAVNPEVPLSPQDVLKAYEIAMSLLAERASADFSDIVQAQQSNQIRREQAEYLVRQRYEVAMMQYQVLSALHDVLKHDIDQATEQMKSSPKTTNSDTALMVPLPDTSSER